MSLFQGPNKTANTTIIIFVCSRVVACVGFTPSRLTIRLQILLCNVMYTDIKWRRFVTAFIVPECILMRRGKEIEATN